LASRKTVAECKAVPKGWSASKIRFAIIFAEKPFAEWSSTPHTEFPTDLRQVRKSTKQRSKRNEEIPGLFE
jgi:hypothetical protein